MLTYINHRSNRILLLAMFLFFWGISTSRLDRYPTVQYDEPAIVAPGYFLITQGFFGSPMFTGFFGQEALYLEVTPLMSLLQGLTVYGLGVGVWQIRFVPVAAGLLTMALTYAVARRVASTVGVIAVFLLLFWQWIPGRETYFGSGIPLIDIVRIGRYDILVPVFGLSSLWVWGHPRRQTDYRLSVLSGLLAGLAGLANVYGLLWVAVLLVLLITEHHNEPTRIARGVMMILLGVVVIWLGWLCLLLLNWPNALGQFRKHDGRLNFWALPFYIESVLNEARRYRIWSWEPANGLRAGFWLLVVGMPIGIFQAANRLWRHNDQRGRLLLIPALLIPIAFALFDIQKRIYYLATVVPLFAILIAWAAVVGLNSRNIALRLIVILVGSIICIQGLSSIWSMQAEANKATPPSQFYQALVPLLPSSGRILGPPEYWLGLPERDYRSIALPFLIADPMDTDAPSFIEAMTEIAPDIVLLHPSLPHGLEYTTTYYQLPESRAEQFWTFMADHKAELIGELLDFNGDLVQVYQLVW